MTGGKNSAQQNPLAHACKGWFPVNQTLLEKIKQNFKEGFYNNNREDLIGDIKKDFSLFSHVLRSLGRIVEEDKKSKSPIAILREAEIEELKRVLDAPSSELSLHVFDASQKAQTNRIRHLIVSCGAAEAMSAARGLDTELALVCAVIRQLGLTLIAYNYPRIYAQALSALKKDEDSLERILKKILGFSPLQLGIKAGLNWSTNPQLRVGWGEDLSEPDLADPLSVFRHRGDNTKEGEELRRICEVGEELARLTDPEHFPSSEKRWGAVNTQIRTFLGPHGMQLIKERVESHSTAYLALDNLLFKTDLAPEKSVNQANQQYQKKLLEKNTFIKELEIELKESFHDVYRLISIDALSTEAVSLLVGDVAPQSGFDRGCFYLADYKRMKLMPILRLGRAELVDYKPLNMIDEGSNVHPVVEALDSQTPLRQENCMINGEAYSFIAGCLGSTEKKGVLFLEMSGKLASKDRSYSVNLFKAIRHTLTDCLMIK
jgi:hypothetical protein